MSSSHDERRADRDQRRQAKYARKYGFTMPPDMPNPPRPPRAPMIRVSVDDDDDDVYEKLPIDQRPDTQIEPGMSEIEINARIRRRIALRVKQRNEFLTHLVSFVVVNAMLWAIWIGTGHDSFPWPLFVTGGWGIGLFAHAAQIYQNSAAVSARRERIVQREVEMEKARLGISGYDYEKPKRVYRDSIQSEREAVENNQSDPPLTRSQAQTQSQSRDPVSQRVRLSDDGELVPVDDDSDLMDGKASSDDLNRSNRATRARNDRDA